MTQIKHTQGPWVDYGHNGQINGADNSYICQVESKNTKADIALIAAAPELLEALIASEHLLSEQYAKKPDHELGVSITQIRAAIAKATA